MTVATPTAFAVQTALFWPTTLQEILDLAHHELRQTAGLFGLLAEGWPVLLEHLIRYRWLWSMALVVISCPGKWVMSGYVQSHGWLARQSHAGPRAR